MQQSAERSLIICQFEIRLRILSQYNYKVYVVMCWPGNQCDLLLFGSVGQLLRHCVEVILSYSQQMITIGHTL